MNSNNQQKTWQSFREKIEFLKQSDSYHEDNSLIESIETHMSWVFLTDKHAYKIKKPVEFSFLDFSHITSRFLNCHKEIKLNQPLAPDIYLDVVPMIQSHLHAFYPIDWLREGNIVDWLVKMRRFPREQTLDNVILRDNIDESLLLAAAYKLVKFYQDAHPLPLHPKEYILRLHQYIDENYQALLNKKYQFNQSVIIEMHEAQMHQLDLLSEYITHRVLEGRIIECHGDLRPEHICLISPPIFTDRLEFNTSLRIMDPVAELSYLSLECEFLGKPEVGAFFLQIYQKEFPDIPDPRLTEFYKSYKACLRAKISAWHLDDEHVVNQEKWHKKAKAYLNLATKIMN
ncbi:hypothetical protein [Legionella nagasakiensis]|uniref:hypothetical protein n=1 Tax=Legionella nagasakiensis TaxID=535290 RepID=UPI001055CAD9|nr:hypothetical protein [Legionella nagasakiensis]